MTFDNGRVSGCPLRCPGNMPEQLTRGTAPANENLVLAGNNTVAPEMESPFDFTRMENINDAAKSYVQAAPDGEVIDGILRVTHSHEQISRLWLSRLPRINVLGTHCRSKPKK